MRGVNKLVVEIKNPDSAYFERAILFVRPQRQDATQREIQKEATQLLGTLAPKPRRKVLPVLLPTLIFLCGVGFIVCGALLLGGMIF
jgi:hypothetical protein